MTRSGAGGRLSVAADGPIGAIQRQVAADLDALVTTHPMGEALAAIALRLAGLLDADLQSMAVSGVTRELRETLLELARLAVNDDDDLDAQLSRPSVPAAVRDPEKP